MKNYKIEYAPKRRIFVKENENVFEVFKQHYVAGRYVLRKDSYLMSCVDRYDAIKFGLEEALKDVQACEGFD